MEQYAKRHTPGPWEVTEGDSITARTDYLATVAYSTVGEKETAANARLIAAAPDLLAIVESMVMYPDIRKYIAANFPGLIKEANAVLVEVGSNMARSDLEGGAK